MRFRLWIPWGVLDPALKKKTRNWLAFPAIFLLLNLYCSREGVVLTPGSTVRAQIILPNGHNDTLRTQAIFSVPRNYRAHMPYPLLVALHGYGDNAEAFHDLWKPVTDSLGFVLLTPQGENKVVEPISWGWGENAERIILTSIDLVKKQVLLNPKKVYMTGFSQGGTIAYMVGFKHPSIFAGVAPLAAKFGDGPLPAKPKGLARLRIYIGHGDRDTNFDDAQQAAAALTRLGMRVKFRPYENIGHSLPQTMRQELANIIMFFQE